MKPAKPSAPSAVARTPFSPASPSLTRGVNAPLTDVEETRVTFREISDSELDEYMDSGEPFDKAGGYGIQGAGGRFVSSVEGDYYNVIGLPLALVSRMLSRFINTSALPPLPTPPIFPLFVPGAKPQAKNS